MPMRPDSRPVSPEFMTITELAEYLRLPVRTIYHWRQTGTGPQGKLFGRHLRFRRSAVEAWIEAQT
jgi:excisionase family DNA binding protein